MASFRCGSTGHSASKSPASSSTGRNLASAIGSKVKSAFQGLARSLFSAGEAASSSQAAPTRGGLCSWPLVFLCFSFFLLLLCVVFGVSGGWLVFLCCRSDSFRIRTLEPVHEFCDEGRKVYSITMDSRERFAATADLFGRVFLLDVHNFLVLKVKRNNKALPSLQFFSCLVFILLTLRFLRPLLLRFGRGTGTPSVHGFPILTSVEPCAVRLFFCRRFVFFPAFS